MSRRLHLIAILFVVANSAIFSSSVTISGENAAIPAVQLLTAYTADISKSDGDFKNKAITIAAEITGKESAFFGAYLFAETDQGKIVFDFSSKDVLTLVDPKDGVVVRGNCTGINNKKEITLKKCELISHSRSEENKIQALPASSFVADYHKNEKEMEEKYKGKEVVLVGELGRITDGFFSGAYVIMNTPHGDFQFDFSTKNKNAIPDNINSGDNVAISGICKGFSLRTLMIDKGEYIPLDEIAYVSDLIERNRIVKTEKEQASAEKNEAEERERQEKFAQIKPTIEKALDAEIIYRIDLDKSTAWVDETTWRTLNRDHKENMILMVGYYISLQKSSSEPYAYIRSYSNDDLLGETKVFGGVKIYK